MYDVIYNLTRSKCHSKVNFRDSRLPECANFNAIWQKSFHSLDPGTSKNFGTIPNKGAVRLPYEPRINEIIEHGRSNIFILVSNFHMSHCICVSKWIKKFVCKKLNIPDDGLITASVRETFSCTQ